MPLAIGRVALDLAGTVGHVKPGLVVPGPFWIRLARGRRTDLVELEPGFDVVAAPLQAGGDRHRVLDRLRAALAHERQHRMAGVAQHGDAAKGPALDRRAVEHRPDEGLVHRVDDALHLRVPAGIGGAQVVDAAGLGPGLADPVRPARRGRRSSGIGRPRRSSGRGAGPARARRSTPAGCRSPSRPGSDRDRRGRRTAAAPARAGCGGRVEWMPSAAIRASASMLAPLSNCGEHLASRPARTPTQRCDRCTRSGGTALASSACSSPRWKIMCGAPNAFSIVSPSGVRVSVRPSCQRR